MQSRAVPEQYKAVQSSTKQYKAVQSSIEQYRAVQSRAEQYRAEKSRAEQKREAKKPEQVRLPGNGVVQPAKGDMLAWITAFLFR